MKKITVLTFMLCCFFSNAGAAGLTASVDKTTVPLGEAFVLTLSADESVNEMPDLSVLEKNFKVYSTSVSRQNYIINGKSEASTNWQIGLIALNPGSQEIPSVTIGKDKTKPVQINVISTAAQAAAPADATNPQSGVSDKDNTQVQAKYNLRALIENKTQPHYVQQQIIYKVVLTDDGSFAGSEPVFENESAGSWIIRSLGRPQTVVKTADNKKVRETTFTYALFPQKSGKQKIPEVWLNGYAVKSGTRTGFDIFNQDIFNFSINMPSFFGMDTPVSLRVPSKEIEILPVPENYPGNWWLPAEKVVINAKWQEEKPHFKAGEAFNREITLQAVGVTESQLPDIDFPSSPELRQYPEKAVRQSGLVNGFPAAEVKVNNVYIPKKSGKVLLPEIAVDWYNTQSGTFEKAVIPAEEIEVEEGDMAAGIKDTEDSGYAKQVAEPEQNKPLGGLQSETKENISQITDSKPEGMSYLVLIAVFAAGMLVSWLLFRKRPSDGKPQCEMRQYPEYLIKKAYQNDFRSLRDGLVSWATGFYPEHRIENLKDVAAAAGDSRFEEQINIILAKLYNPQDESLWNPKIFSDILKDLVKNKKGTAGKNPPLPPLYG